MTYYEFTYKDKKYRINEEDLVQYEYQDSNPQTNYAIYCQRDPRWKDLKLGFGKTTIGNYGCFVTCLSMMVQKTPDIVNEILKKAKAFNNDLLISDKAAEALGLDYQGKEYNLSKEPDFSPSIKEVTMGKSQHFVLRVKENNKKFIIDPWTGKKQIINYYPFKSYRLFKQK